MRCASKIGEACLFAREPEQLSPVLRSADALARNWREQSAFSEMPRRDSTSVALLDERSPMTGPINDLVSDLFYGCLLAEARCHMR